ncbi:MULTISPECIES: pyridoxal phosphate-dependent aminotransferase [Rhizobium/Agrobacterium group]|uniref:aspartate transaminase n=2 Tax=Neorhizobium TaxID=1525371 RepID=A0ABV0M5V2_9HYPH|nr:MULTISPECIES: pyridoxal phosphate-dependent aminotransferase [Rhizobium/Agrobacterium group]KGD96294.1 aminotransferase [Rhizobium sp. YS-1r]MCC2611719.1 pyridoxal phosphate-dependent aminotransferase [Neorhizobium petrolearium]WGI66892.1 pyridoxal phosphate-dependent aminotransferase [Neorhizobium petrolearium]
MRYASITDRLAHLGSGRWAVHLAARRMKAAGEEIIELTIGEPDVAPDKALLDEAARAMYAGRTRYSNGRGEPSILEALVRKYSKRRPDVTEKNFLCFPGTQTALYSVMTGLAEAGDGVLVGDPLYATYEGVIASTGAHMIPVPLRPEKKFHLQAEDLKRAITPEARVLLLNTPHNPTGAVLTAAEIAAIGDVCRRHDLWIVCDEVYEQLIFEGTPFASPFDIPELAERTIVVSSISKSHAAPGFRSGWAAGPEEFCEKLLPVSETMLFGVQPFISDMTAMALSQHFETADVMRENYRRRAEIVEKAFAGSNLIKPMPPEGGMFVLLDVTATGLNGEEFAWELLHQEKVAVMPGTSFGDQAAGFLRVSLTVPEDVLAVAMGRVGELAGRLVSAEEKRA